MFLRKLGKRGVAMTEYAILLAFVAAIGVAFISDGDLGKSIEGAVAKVVAMLDGTNARNDLLGDLKLAKLRGMQLALQRVKQGYM